MSDAEGLSRKKRVRAAHRGSVTRIVDQVYEVLRAEDGLNVPKLKQQKLTLSGKLDVLSKLDDELIELIHEEEMDEEVEQADKVREKVVLAMIDIDHALERVETRAVNDGRVARGGPSVEMNLVSRDEHPERLSSSTEATLTADLSMDATAGGHGPATVTMPTYLFADHAPSSVGPTVLPAAPALPVTVPVTTVPSTSRSTVPTTHPIVPSLPVTQVKLPKLQLKKFNGDLTKWVTFWDSFESSVHCNPNLSSVDKFCYLNSLLESTAAEAIAGLTMTAANYEEAVSTLKKRFGNTQQIVNRHMDGLLSLIAVTSHHDLKGLRHLHDSVETHVRGLRALGVPAESYGGLLTSILMSKLPSDVRLIISRELTEQVWNVEEMMKILDREVEARERSFSTRGSGGLPRRPHPKEFHTAATLMTSNSGPTHCAYCDQGHTSSSCTVVTDVNARKEVLRKTGRCYVCLRKYHIGKNCRSTTNCSRCRGRHHVTICPRASSTVSSNKATSSESALGTEGSQTQTPRSSLRSTNTMYIDAQTPVLLQTARLQLYNPRESRTPPGCIQVRAIMDSGSQRTYVTRRVKEELCLPTKRTECLRIKTFGSADGQDTTCEVVQLGLLMKDGEMLKLTALVVPFICNPLTSQPISCSQEYYDHLVGLELADSANAEDVLEVDILIGSDVYWRLVTGRVLRGRTGPTAIQTKVGWVLSGPIDRQEVTVNLTLTSTHALRIDTCPIEHSLDDRLRKFWELESMGILKDEASVYEKFIQQISFEGRRYQVSLPWKECHPPLPDNLDLCRGRLFSLLKRLKQNPELLAEYDSVIKDQINRGIVEVVTNPVSADSDRVHYLPHHGVVRRDKATSKLRIVYDASARANGPSLNDCLYTGPKFEQSIFDILLRFRLHRVALAGDIEKAFLMISVKKRDRDSLRFLWSYNPEDESPKVIVLRFTRVVFGVSSSPFLLNATINHHLETYRDADPSFVEKFLSSVYVDDVSFGSSDVESTYELYLKSKSRLAEAGFRLRKFVTNSEELRHQVSANEQSSDEQEVLSHASTKEDDQSYAKSSLGDRVEDTRGTHKILGVQWDFIQDSLVFDIGGISHLILNSEPTKRNVVSMATRFFDPLGVVSPVTVLFKVFFQKLCEAGISWDDPLTGELLTGWNQLISALQGTKVLVIPRCYLADVTGMPKSARIAGFCDASAKAYAAVAYLRLETETNVCVRFLAAKTRVSPLGGMTIPRLELLSALLLSKLVASIQAALEKEICLEEPVCYTDSRVALYWIRGCNQEWKQFVENRVTNIRALTPLRCWRHCPGKENPADMPSRGMSASELSRSHLWLNGPDWLHDLQDMPEEDGVDVVPEVCHQELRCKKMAHTLIVTLADGPRVGELMNCKDFSSFRKLLRVTALVLRFVRLIRARVRGTSDSTPTDAHNGMDDIDLAKLFWLRESQLRLPQDDKFPQWKCQLDLFLDGSQLWRCGGRMSNSDLPSQAQNPILLDKRHHLTTLIVMEAHQRVMHNGAKETLTEVRSAYWLVRGRQFVRKLIHCCVICRKLEGRPYQNVPPPPLPEYRVKKSQPFRHTGVDFAGPLYVKRSVAAEGPKVWLCLYTCCVTRAVHLDLVPDMSAHTFIRSFKRFSARRGIPALMISDNAKTFKSASTMIQNVLDKPEVKAHFSKLQVKWKFNLEKAPWWGGIFERMVRSAKRCLKKAVGKASLTYDELLTLVTEVEAVLNSRPLSYIAMDDLEEPLTPSHLLLGYRVLSLPDPSLSEDVDYMESAGDLTRRMKHLIMTSEKFWRRWKKEYLLELREFHRTCRARQGVRDTVQKGEIVVIHDEGRPRGLWRLGKIEEVIRSSDGRIRGAEVRVQSRTGMSKVLKRPIQLLYPLEICFQEESSSPSEMSANAGNSSHSPGQDDLQTIDQNPSARDTGVVPGGPRERPRRLAALQARTRITDCITD